MKRLRYLSMASAEQNLLRLATLVRDSNDAVIIRDGKGRIIAWNRGAERMYGYSEAEALGIDIRRLIPKNKQNETLALIRMLTRGHTVPSLETQRRTKNGRILDVWLTATGLRDLRGGALDVATTERDITSRKRDEAELRSLHSRIISAQETERKRLSRDLHDGVGQILSGVKFKLESLSGKILSHPEKTRRKIVEAEESLNRAIYEIRRVSQNLMPSELEDLGLQPALVALCRDFQERLGVPVVVRCSGIPALIDPDLALALYRIAQEALNNIEKHSKAARAALTLRRTDRFIELSVADNGRGYDMRQKRAVSGRGAGLGSMRERIQSVGGDLDFSSIPGHGAKVTVRAPLSRAGRSAHESKK